MLLRGLFSSSQKKPTNDFHTELSNKLFASECKCDAFLTFLNTRYDFDTMVKCDDDTIINMSKYHELMKQQDLSVPFFGGVRFGGMPVFRSGRCVNILLC